MSVIVCVLVFLSPLWAGSAGDIFDPAIERRVQELLSRMSLVEKVSLLSGEEWMTTKEIPRLDIPMMRVTDGPHGVGSGSKATCFPTGISLASTWDEELIQEVGVALGQEMRFEGKHILLGPCVNIHRTPLGGRNFESYSEDPYLASKIAVAWIKGIQSQGIGACVKHFASNNQEWERFTISARVGERALREIYLPAFEAAVREANVLSVMGAYNKVNGVYACENKHLLTDILRNEWGFDGFVVSDWNAVHSTAETLKAGCDLEMPGPGEFLTETRVLAAFKKGELKQGVIDESVRRILRAMFWLGLFDGPQEKHRGAKDTPDHRNLARRVAENAIVLLKNEGNILPLDIEKVESIAVIGPNAGVARLGGGGSSTVSPTYSISPLDGLREKCGQKVVVRYAEGCSMLGNLGEIPPKLLTPPSAGRDVHGLEGEYFDNKHLNGRPLLRKIDSKIDFNWGQGSPASKIPEDNFSVRWRGQITPDRTMRYDFGLASDDGSRLYIGNRLLIDNWGDHSEACVRKSVYLEAGRHYNVRLEYYESWGDAVMRFGMNLPEEIMLGEALKVARESDVAIIFVGLNARYEGEGYDKKSLELPQEQDTLIQRVAKVNRNTIVVLVNGTPVVMDEWIDSVPAILEAWYPGQEGGSAIANILFGDVNPSGKMPCTFPKKYEDVASSKNYPGQNGNVHYREGIFVGYRHFDRNNIEPLFPFGHGLSYTKFEYSNLEIKPEADLSFPVEVKVDIENTGRRAGKEVVQLYVQDVKSSLDRPVKELKRFRKISLKSGEKKVVKFFLDERALSFYNPARKGWVMEPGEFKIMVGSSSRDIRLVESFRMR